MVKEELYNIHNIISFRLVNHIRKSMILNDINPEYKFFKSNNKCQNHFEILVKDQDDPDCNIKLKNGKVSWRIGLQNYVSKNKLYVSVNIRGLRNRFPYTAIKNLYVRSVMMDKLLDSDAALVHSGAFKVNGKAVIISGRPGVFKTSILMDAIRSENADFLGEENCLVSNKMVYPFPLNIESISYKIKNYKDENPSNKLQKAKLGLHLFKDKSYNSLKLANPSSIDTVVYLEKGSEFKINSVSFEDILPKLIENEVDELSIPPTHTLSGIKYNYFKELLMEEDNSYITNFRNRLKLVFAENFYGKHYFMVTSPEKYDVSIMKALLETINNNEK